MKSLTSCWRMRTSRPMWMTRMPFPAAAPYVDGMTEYIESGNMTDYQDHYYPSEMAADAILQTYVIDKDTDAFLARFDKDWQRYNRDIIREVQEYEENGGNE